MELAVILDYWPNIGGILVEPAGLLMKLVEYWWNISRIW